MATEVERAVVAVGYAYDRAAERVATVGIGKVLAAATAATAAVVGLARQQAAANDEVVKAARDLDVPIGRLQAYEAAAGLAGVQTTELQTALGTLQRSIRQAASGTGEQAALFRRMGIEATNADGSLIGTAEAFDMIADSIGGLGSTADQSAALQLLLGGRGLTANRIRGMLAGGSEAIDEVEDRLQSLGAVLSDDVGRASEELTDAFSWLGLAFQGVGNDVFEDLIPALVPLVERVTDLVGASDGAVRALSRGFGDALGAVFRGMNTDAGFALAAIVGVAGAIGSVATAGSLVAAAGAAVPVIGGVTSALAGAALPAAVLAAALGGVFVALDTTAESSEATAKATTKLADGTRGAADEADRAVGLWGVLGQYVETVGLGFRALALTIAETAGYAAGLTMQAWALGEPFIELVRQVPGIQLLERALEGIGAVVGEVVGRMTDFSGQIETLSEAGEAFGRGDLMGGLRAIGARQFDDVTGVLNVVGREAVGTAGVGLDLASENMRALDRFAAGNRAAVGSAAQALAPVVAPPIALERAVYNLTVGSAADVAAQVDNAHRIERASILYQLRASGVR